MTQFLDLDAVERRARECATISRVPGFDNDLAIDPQTVLELVRLLRTQNVRACETRVREIPFTPRPKLELSFAEEPPCSCEQSQALEARVAGLEAEAKRQSAADKRLADWLRTVDAGSVLITKGGVSLCWHDHCFERREAHVADNALDPLDLGQRATLLNRVLDAAGAPKELT